MQAWGLQMVEEQGGWDRRGAHVGPGVSGLAKGAARLT